MLVAAGFVARNRWEDELTEETSRLLLKNVQSILEEKQPQPPLPDVPALPPADEEPPPPDTEEPPADTEPLPPPPEESPAQPEEIPVRTEELPKEMATVKVEGYDCIGILDIPVLKLQLPVLADWSYAKLKIAPCQYYGTYYEKDFVIAAHNYKAHFSRLSELRPGDPVIFTDVNGTARRYEVILLETLPKEATKEMITSGFDLSLYTCTVGGANRVTVRCSSVPGEYR